MNQSLNTAGASSSGYGWAALTAELDDLRTTGRWLPGPATTLEVTSRSGFEADHERLIAWLLNPLAAHNLGPAVLAATLQRIQARPDAVGTPPREELSRSRVRRQVARVNSRPDIVVEMPHHTLVIELKINSEETAGQTSRQADDYADVPGAIHIFLTFRDRQPSDRRSLQLLLRDFAEDLRQILDRAPEPTLPAAVVGRATAADYLATLERMLGMDPVDQEAARFWLKHGKNLSAAREAARRLLAHLPAHARTALESLAADLGEDFAISSFEDVSTGSNGIDYPEHVVLLVRKRWIHPDGKVRLGIGLGQSKKPDPTSNLHRPFCGIYAADPQVYASLRETWEPESKPWGNWARWQLLDLEPPHDNSDLLAHYADVVQRQARCDWEKNRSVLERVMDHPTS
ncbi:MAG: PD-(D/E)XK nuclease family protein [Streptosporangiaceae bacterium]